MLMLLVLNNQALIALLDDKTLPAYKIKSTPKARNLLSSFKSLLGKNDNSRVACTKTVSPLQPISRDSYTFSK